MDFKNAIVLTGGIGSGKSTVGTLLMLYGYLVIDADKISHKILDENSFEIEKLFGSSYIKDGKVDRKELGKLVFSNSEVKKSLESILHPKIKAQIIKEAKIFEREGVDYFIDIPLFYETKNYNIDRVLVVYTPRDKQLERALKRDDRSKEYINSILDAQIDIEKKKELASYLIDNSLDLKHLQKEVDKFVERLKNKDR
jgi:dephospho-CoA kinase